MSWKTERDRTGDEDNSRGRQTAADDVAGVQDVVGESGGEEPAGHRLETAAAGVALTAEEVEALRAKASKADEHWDRLLRVQADLENYRKRAVRERQEAVVGTQVSLLGRLLPVLDSFEMALEAARESDGTNLETLKAGLGMMQQQLRATLGEAGLEEIDASNQPFNPSLHEALSTRETAEVPEGHVLQQVRKGYRLGERLVRPASVIVARNPGAA
jgi:molecular chaperone GrpE